VPPRSPPLADALDSELCLSEDWLAVLMSEASPNLSRGQAGPASDKPRLSFVSFRDAVVPTVVVPASVLTVVWGSAEKPLAAPRSGRS
jgi:hypothetical protein